MRVVLSTISKFHTFDLARQMERLGVLERLFTGRPYWKIKDEGLPLDKVSTFSPFQTIFEGMGKLGLERYPFKNELNWWCHQSLDEYVARNFPACHVFHALAYCGLKSGQVAQRRGAKWVCDVVNSHLVFQDEILAEEYDLVGLPYTKQDPRLLEYAITSYEQADLITLPSTFVKQTFLNKGIPEEKLKLIPYGVNLNHFQPVPVIADECFRILFVGQLSVRKGIHYLVKGFQLAAIPNSELTLVGSVLPETTYLLNGMSNDRIKLTGPLPKIELPSHYSRADVMVFPSVEDGFGYVIGEAMACGCPVIATEHTGGRDFFTNGLEGFVVPIRSPEAIAERLVWLYEHPVEHRQMKQAALRRVHSMGGWDNYGDAIFKTFQSLATPNCV
jgi:glycosyltransferase involved in cell wall biosynthesis